MSSCTFMYCGKILACFEIIENYKRIALFSTNPDDNFNIIPGAFIDVIDNQNDIYLKTLLVHKKQKL